MNRAYFKELKYGYGLSIHKDEVRRLLDAQSGDYVRVNINRKKVGDGFYLTESDFEPTPQGPKSPGNWKPLPRAPLYEPTTRLDVNTPAPDDSPF